MTDLSTFLTPRPDSETEVTRQLAWMCQNICNARAWCVGQKIVEAPRKVRPHSPLLSQLAKLGCPIVSKDVSGVLAAWGQLTDRQTKLDVMLFDPVSSTVFVVKGQSSSLAKSISPKLRIATRSERATLFEEDKAFLSGVYAKSDAISALCFARALIDAATPSDVHVRALFLTVEDVEGSGKFQAHELGPTAIESVKDTKVSVDQFPVVFSSEDYAAELREDPEALLAVPDWSDSDYLRKAPVDLPIRSLMILRYMTDTQAERGARLVLRGKPEIENAVSSNYKLHYPKNMCRHDVDRLQQVGLLGLAPDGTSRLGLTSAGVARMAVIDHRFNRMVPRSPASILDKVSHQESLWVNASLV